jgi:hypothetical protein
MYKNKTFIQKLQNYDGSIVKQVIYFERSDIYDFPRNFFFNFQKNLQLMLIKKFFQNIIILLFFQITLKRILINQILITFQESNFFILRKITRQLQKKIIVI